jgi:ectoine hydroxylase-related dioxygenase (phytanoyl-CoA dioxygenase family)
MQTGASKLIYSSLQESTGQWRERLNGEGYLIFPSVLSAERIGAVRTALNPYLQGELLGRNDFEGRRTERVYALLAKSPVFADLVSDPLVMTLGEAVLGANFLLSACLAINLHPGETAQTLHFDDGFYRVPRPRPAYSLSVVWNVDPFTEDNGATEIIPRSHLWGEEGPHGHGSKDVMVPKHIRGEEGHPDLVPVKMPPGSLLIFLGTVWHRGGANRSDKARLAITPQYCAAWVRQQEAMVLAVPPDIAASYSEKVQQLLGYSIHPPFMGHVNGLHPKRTLAPKPVTNAH